MSDWSSQYDGMPEPMPSPTPNKPKPKKKTPGSKVKLDKGGINPMGYTPSIGAGNMSFDYKMN